MRLFALLSLTLVLACSSKSDSADPQKAPATSTTPAKGAKHKMPEAHRSAAKHNGHAGHFAHRFKNPAEWAARFDDPKRDAWQKPGHLVAVLDIKPGMKVADIGAGTGYLLSHLSAAVGAKGTVVGLDVEPAMVNHMMVRARKAKLENVSARVVSTTDPGLNINSVDRITILNTWHHIPNRHAYAAKLKAALKSGGLIAVIDYTKDSPHGPPAKHRLTAEQVKAELEKAGLSAVVIKEDLPHQYVVVARSNGKTSTATNEKVIAFGPHAIPLVNARMFQGVLVGGRITADQLRTAARTGVKTIINLQLAKERGVAEEVALVKQLGLRYVSIPIGTAGDLNAKNAAKLDAALKHAAGKVIVHCVSGNRVGALFATRAFLIKKQSAKKSLAIAKAAGVTRLEPAVRKILGL